MGDINWQRKPRVREIPTTNNAGTQKKTAVPKEGNTRKKNDGEWD